MSTNVTMNRSLMIIGAALLLTACTAQTALNHASPICLDGVEYLAYQTLGKSGESIVPHFKPDGSLYTCKVTR